MRAADLDGHWKCTLLYTDEQTERRNEESFRRLGSHNRSPSEGAVLNFTVSEGETQQQEEVKVTLSQACPQGLGTTAQARQFQFVPAADAWHMSNTQPPQAPQSDPFSCYTLPFLGHFFWSSFY